MTRTGLQIFSLLCVLFFTGCWESEKKNAMHVKVDLSAIQKTQSKDLRTQIPAVCYFINVKDTQAPRVRTPNAVPADQSADCLGFETVSDLVTPAIATTSGITMSMQGSNFNQTIELYGVLGMPCGSSSLLGSATAASEVYLFASTTVTPGSQEIVLAPTAATIDPNDRWDTCRNSDLHTVGGVVTGLKAASVNLVLQNKGGDNVNVPANGAFTFPTALAAGTSYSTTVFTQATGQTCTVTNGSGEMGTSNITNVVVTCASVTVSSISPSVGAVAGLTPVDIYGRGFIVGSTTVKIGGVTCTGVAVTNSAVGALDQIHCITGTSSAGTADVVVTVGDDTGTLTAGYTYVSPPTAASSLNTSQLSQTTLTLGWTDNSNNETGFTVEKSYDNTNFTTVETTTANITSYNVTGLTANTLYYFRVLAVNAGGSTANTTNPSVTTLPIPPAAPTIGAISSISQTTLTVSWTDNSSNETGFVVEKSTDGSTYAYLTQKGASVTSHNVNGLTANTLYYFRVYATNSGGDSSPSSNVSATTLILAPVLSSQSDLSFPSNQQTQGTAIPTIDFNNTLTSNDSGMTYTCYFDKVVDGTVNATSTCATLPKTAGSFVANTGVLTWTPSTTAYGPFEIKVTGSNAGGSDSKIFVIDVKPNYLTTNLRGDWDAQFANLTSPYVNTASSPWKNLLPDSSKDGVFLNPSHATWVGDGTTSNVNSPYALALEGIGSVGFGTTVLANQTKMLFTAWVKPASVSTPEAVILENIASNNGFSVRHSYWEPAKLEFVVGADQNYSSVVAADNPVGYWRLGETTGTVAVNNVTTPTNNGTYSNSSGALVGVTLGVTNGIRSSDHNRAAQFNGTTGYVGAISPTLNTNNFTLEAWVYPTATQIRAAIVYNGDDSSTGGYGMLLGDASVPGTKLWGRIGSGTPAWFDSGCTLSITQWSHVVMKKETTASGTITLWVNGVVCPYTSTGTTNGIYNSFTIAKDPAGIGGYFAGLIDEVAVYQTAISSNTIQAHYMAGATCQSTTTLAINNWKFIAGIFDGTSAKLFVGGTEECSLTSSLLAPAFVSSTAHLKVGVGSAGGNFWTGSIADLKVYGTSDNSPVGTSTDITNTYTRTLNRY